MSAFNICKMFLLFELMWLFSLSTVSFGDSFNQSKYAEAQKFYKNRNYQKVISILQQEIKENSSDVMYYELMGHSYFQLNSKLQAKEYYDRAISLGSKDVIVFLNQASLSGDLETQKYWLYKATEIEPLHAAANATLFTILQANAIDALNKGEKDAALMSIYEAKEIIYRYMRMALGNPNYEDPKMQTILLLFSNRLKDLDKLENSVTKSPDTYLNPN